LLRLRTRTIPCWTDPPCAPTAITSWRGRFKPSASCICRWASTARPQRSTVCRIPW